MNAVSLKVLVSLIFVIALLPGVSRSQEENQPEGRSILDWYPKADSLANYPSLEDTLVILCQKHLQKRYISFIGRKGTKKIFIMAVTLEPIKNLRKELTLIADFEGGRPSIGKLKSWGYIFDRNGDGKIDYMALIGGAAGVEDERFPEAFPKRDQIMNTQQLEYFVGHCKLIFNHWADDNFDGKIDAAVHLDMDPDRDWVKRHLVIRSTKFNRVFDDVWAFPAKISDDRDSVRFTGSAVPYFPLGQSAGKITWKDFDEVTAILDLVNRAAKQCDIGGEDVAE